MVQPGLFEIQESTNLSAKAKDAILPQRLRFYSSTMTVQFSAKRSVSLLVAHLLIYLREMLQESKMSSKQLRVWSTNSHEVEDVLKQLDRLRETFEQHKRSQQEQLSNTNISVNHSV